MPLGSVEPRRLNAVRDDGRGKVADPKPAPRRRCRLHSDAVSVEKVVVCPTRSLQQEPGVVGERPGERDLLAVAFVRCLAFPLEAARKVVRVGRELRVNLGREELALMHREGAAAAVHVPPPVAVGHVATDPLLRREREATRALVHVRVLHHLVVVHGEVAAQVWVEGANVRSLVSFSQKIPPARERDVLCEQRGERGAERGWVCLAWSEGVSGVGIG